ncbi:uncharacterized protein LOC102075798 isoform X3 [Oreochromis niloticus]|uniref:uncharacterized protein LOC102075798 isoform X3 n=1 Tax=Oreochromis niloticus TaxID=8128 RepID=UPI000904F4C4|nr:uncharacterized protein LOC102075798 isoform X3 [Oreochromis niloticus]
MLESAGERTSKLPVMRDKPCYGTLRGTHLVKVAGRLPAYTCLRTAVWSCSNPSQRSVLCLSQHLPSHIQPRLPHLVWHCRHRQRLPHLPHLVWHCRHRQRLPHLPPLVWHCRHRQRLPHLPPLVWHCRHRQRLPHLPPLVWHCHNLPTLPCPVRQCQRSKPATPGLELLLLCLLDSLLLVFVFALCNLKLTLRTWFIWS